MPTLGVVLVALGVLIVLSVALWLGEAERWGWVVFLGAVFEGSGLTLLGMVLGGAALVVAAAGVFLIVVSVATWGTEVAHEHGGPPVPAPPVSGDQRSDR